MSTGDFSPRCDSPGRAASLLPATAHTAQSEAIDVLSIALLL